MSILWGKERHLNYWAALEADAVPAAERRAMGLLASMADEKRFAFYCHSGMFPALGNVTKRIYMIRRWTTVLELEDGRPRASWCILAQDRQIAPETDHVVAMKNLVEGSELHFREVGNAFHYSEDPFRGQVDPKTNFLNPYYNQIGPTRRGYEAQYELGDNMQAAPLVLTRPRDAARARIEQEWNEDSAMQFRSLEGWMKALRIKAEFQAEEQLNRAKNQAVRKAAAFRPELLRGALVERAKDWVRIPPKERYKLPKTQFEEMAERAMGLMGRVGGMYGLGQAAGGIGNSANATGITITADTATNNTYCVNNSAQITIGGMFPTFPPQQAYVAQTLA